MQKPNVLKYLEALIGETPLMEFNSSKPSNWKKILQIITIMATKRIQLFVMDLNKNKLFIFLFSYSYSIKDIARKFNSTIKDFFSK